MHRSPLPDVAIPDVSLPEFVLGEADGRGDKPALIDGPSGRTITYRELAGRVRAAAAGLTERGFGKGDVFAHYSPNLPEYAVAFHAVAMLGGVNTTANPLLTGEELGHQLADCGARFLVTVEPLLDKAREAAGHAGLEEIFVYGEADGATPFASLLRPGRRGARGRDRPGSRPRRAAVLERHDRPAEGSHADAPQPRREHLPDAGGASHARGRPCHRRAAVLPHLRHGRDHERAPAPRRDDRDDAAVRPRGLPARRSRTTASRAPTSCRRSSWRSPSTRSSTSTTSRSLRARLLGRRAARAPSWSRRAAERLGCRVQQGYGLTETSPVTHCAGRPRRTRRPGSIGPPVPNTECRVVDVVTGEDAAPRRARRALGPRPAGDEGLPQQPGGDRADDRRRRLAAHRRHRLRRRGRATSASSTGSRS